MLHHLRAFIHFPQKRIQIRRDQLALAHGLAGEGAVGAAGAAEGDGDVYVGLFHIRLRQLELLDDDAAQKIALFRAYVKLVFNRRLRFLHGKTFSQTFIKQSRGTDARQRSPRRAVARQTLDEFIERHLAKTLDHTLMHDGQALRLISIVGFGRQNRLTHFFFIPEKEGAICFSVLFFVEVLKTLAIGLFGINAEMLHSEKQLEHIGKLIGKPFKRSLQRNANRFHQAFTSAGSWPTAPKASWPG